MAQLNFGALVVAARGSVGVETYSVNRGGPYLKARTAPPFTATATQLIARNYITTASQTWPTLSDAQRALWDRAAKRINYKNIWGDVKKWCGYVLYMKVNVNRQLCVLSLLTAFPGTFKLGFQPITNVVADLSTGSIRINYPVQSSTNYQFITFASPGVSPGKSSKSVNFFKIRSIQVAVSTFSEVGAAYITKFGAIPAVGKKIWIKVVLIERATGMPGIPSIISTIVVP